MHPDNPPRILRTLVFRSGVDEESILEEAGNGMDALCLDLEDSTPKDRLGEARETFRGIARKLTDMGVVVMTRINAIEDGAEEDLEAVICPELHCINIPKASSSDQMRQYVSLIDKAEFNHGMPIGYTLVRPVTETAEGVMRAFEIFSASDRIAYAGGVTGSFGGDLGWTVGMDYTSDGIESLYLRSKIIIEARVAGVPFPIGGGPTAVKTVEALRQFAIQNKKLGYDGFYTPGVKYWPNSKEAVTAANEVFTPTKEDVGAWLQRYPNLEHPRMRERVELARRLGVV